MKKYIVSVLIFFVVHGCCAMELAKLSSEDDAKALGFAKLFNKYPHGFGDDKKAKEANKNKMNALLKQKTPFSLCVVKYSNDLKNIEGEEVLDGIYIYNVPSDLQQKILLAGILDEEMKQCYAMSKALEFIKITRDGYYDFFDIDLYKRCFLSEINADNKYNLSVSDPVYHAMGS